MGFGDRIPAARKERGKIKAAFPPVPLRIDFHVTGTDPMEGGHVQQVPVTEQFRNGRVIAGRSAALQFIHLTVNLGGLAREVAVARRLVRILERIDGTVWQDDRHERMPVVAAAPLGDKLVGRRDAGGPQCHDKQGGTVVTLAEAVLHERGIRLGKVAVACRREVEPYLRVDGIGGFLYSHSLFRSKTVRAVLFPPVFQRLVRHTVWKYVFQKLPEAVVFQIGR